MQDVYWDDFDCQIQADELVDEAEGFDWDEYYVDEPENAIEYGDDKDMDPGHVDLDWLYEELNTYEIDGDF